MRYLILAICLLLYNVVFGQQGSRAQTYYERAMTQYAGKKPVEAREALTNAVKEDPSNAEYYSMLGKWYYDAQLYKEAAEVFRQASANCRDGHKAFAKPLTRSLLASYNPTGAMAIIASHADSSAEWKRLRGQALFMEKELRKSVKDSLTNLGPRINTEYPELHPWISFDTEVLYFTRRVNGVDEDMFRALIDTCGGWLYGRNMGSPPNTPAGEGSQMISADNHYLFFTRCENRNEKGWERGGCDLYMAYTGTDTWSVPESFGATINSPYYEGMPCLSADNKMLFFVSDRNGGYGGLDIWMAEFKGGLWQEPVNMGTNINTPGNETAPFLHLDNQTFYFSSDGHTGLGGADLFYCHRINDTTWSNPKNMGLPINSSANESGICISVDGNKAFVSSDRDSVAGNFDLYETTLDKSLKPVPVVIINGFAYDSLGSKNRLTYASIYIYDSASGRQMYHFVSNRGDGSYMITLPVGKTYTYSADRIGYLESRGNFTLTADMAFKNIEYNVPLLPQGYQKPIEDSLVLTVNFVKNSRALSKEDKDAIFYALDPWLLDKDFVVIVNGYTDASGTPMINEELSAIRANLVAEEIISLGVDPTAVSAKGYGEADPIMPNDTEEHMDINRRVEIILRR